MHFADLTPYVYSAVPTGLPGTWNVGWLKSTMPYTRGRVDADLSRRLAHIIGTPVLLTRGRHECDLCHSTSGNGELWIAGANGDVYAAPVLISHYIDAHEYAPPAEFLAALRESQPPLSEDDCDLRIRTHLEKLRAAPGPEDILVPYYTVRICWRRDAFSDLDAFLDFLSYACEGRFDTHLMLPDGFVVVAEAHDPGALFREIFDISLPLHRTPFKCTYTLVYLATGYGEIFADPV